MKKYESPERAPEGYEWVCSSCGKHSTDRQKLKGGQFPCYEEALLCALDSGMSKEFDEANGGVGQ